MSKKKEAELIENKFTKEQLLNSNKYKHNKDALSVLLIEDRSYSIQEVEKLLTDFMKGKVK